jgi:hypothetical protein
MEFAQIKEELNNIVFDALRVDCDNNFEAVIVKEELAKLVERLEKFFGSPVFPSKNRMPLEMRLTVDAFGGIMPGQTLYFNDKNEGTVFAMLWPWKDGQRTTLKIVKK